MGKGVKVQGPYGAEALCIKPKPFMDGKLTVSLRAQFEIRELALGSGWKLSYPCNPETKPVLPNPQRKEILSGA